MSAIDVVCSECGSSLDAVMDPYGSLKIQPCDACLAQARDDGYEDGRSTGFDDGYEQWYDARYN